MGGTQGRLLRILPRKPLGIVCDRIQNRSQGKGGRRLRTLPEEHDVVVARNLRRRYQDRDCHKSQFHDSSSPKEDCATLPQAPPYSNITIVRPVDDRSHASL